jgi:CRP-like cAMP-binding protein
VPKISQKPDKSQVELNSSGLGLNDQKKQPMIELELLRKYGAKEVTLDKDDFIFREGEEAMYYFQVIEGFVKMMTDSPEGKEFIQGIFKANNSFGKPRSRKMEDEGKLRVVSRKIAL